MSKKGFEGSPNKPGGAAAVVDPTGGETVEKLCELIDLEGDHHEAILACLAELKLLTAANNDALALAEILTSLQAVCDKLLEQADQNAEIITALEALCEKILATNESLALLCEKIEAGQADELACLEDIKLALADILDALAVLNDMAASLEAICEKLDAANASLEALCDKLDAILAAVVAVTAAVMALKECNTAENEALCEKLETLLEVVCPKPPCAAEGTAPVAYTNTDEETEMTVSVGSEGDVKIGSGGGDGSDAEITQYITDCLAAGNDVQWEATGVEGETASGTMLADAETNPFPGFYNDSVNAAPAISFKVSTMTATCLETVEEAGVTLKTYDQCTADQIAALCEKLDGPKPDIEECCTGGATETTAKCANISASWTSMSLGDFDRCTASFGGIDLPDDNYEYADFEALILGVGGTIEPNPNNPDQYRICVPEGFSTCYNRACFNGVIGQLTRACVVALPNTTEPECTNYQRTWGKYEEPIANILETQLDSLQSICEKMELQTAKLCVIEQNSNPAAPCSKPVPEEGLDKEAQTLTISGDVVANYAEGQSIDLQNANAESCGSATSAGGAIYNEKTDTTTIPIVECELDEGKEPVVITMAQPVKTVTLQAIKTIKTLTAVKTLTKEVTK